MNKIIIFSKTRITNGVFKHTAKRFFKVSLSHIDRYIKIMDKSYNLK